MSNNTYFVPLHVPVKKWNKALDNDTCFPILVIFLERVACKYSEWSKLMRKTLYPHLAILCAVMVSLSCGNLKAQTYRILTLGNSITQGRGTDSIPGSRQVSYRKQLFDLMSSGGYNFDLVGHRNEGEELFADGDHCGIPGARAQDIWTLL